MWVSTHAAALQQLMRDWDIYDALTLQAVLENDAGFARARAAAARSRTERLIDDQVRRCSGGGIRPDLFGRQCGGYINCRGDGC